MNINPGIPVMNPAMPAVSNPVPTPPMDRPGGGGTSAPAETPRAMGDTRETEPSRPDAPRDRTTEARADQATRARDEDAAAGRARVEAATATGGDRSAAAADPASGASGQAPSASSDDAVSDNPRAESEAGDSPRMRERLDARMETEGSNTGNRGGEALDVLA
ncbi:MAG: hypothetical protein ACLFMW_06450 [Ectothiorhodospira sp.]